jgi:diguanylate cyclase (GGDEF)-like protein
MLACKVTVLAGSPGLLALLRESCPQYLFVTEVEAEGVRIAIVGSGEESRSLPSHVVVRIMLGESGTKPARKFGELRVSEDAFSADPSSYLAFASDMVATVEHARTIEREFEFFDEIRDLIATSNFDVVYEKVSRTVIQIAPVEHATLLMHDPRIERYGVTWTNDPLFVDDGEFLPAVPSALVQEALGRDRGYATTEADSAHGVLAVYPLQFEEDLIGVLRIRFGSEAELERANLERTGRYVRTVTPVVGNVYQLTRSKELALRDDLTKAFNRRFFEAYLDEEIERARRYSSLLSVIFLDLDDLKSVNDRYGHLVGSRMLQEVAKRILGAVRTIDKVVRFGGDEFCILLPQTDPMQARSVADRVRTAINASPFRPEAGVIVPITASFGIATYPAHASSKEELVRAADAAMYRVKSTTKNAIGVAGEAQPALTGTEAEPA